MRDTCKAHYDYSQLKPVRDQDHALNPPFVVNGRQAFPGQWTSLAIILLSQGSVSVDFQVLCMDL